MSRPWLSVAFLHLKAILKPSMQAENCTFTQQDALRCIRAGQTNRVQLMIMIVTKAKCAVMQMMMEMKVLCKK